MGKSIFVGILGLVVGLITGYLLIFYTPLFAKEKSENYISPLLGPRAQVIGFLPYWLVSTALNDYSDSLTTLTYFGLTAGEDGKIVKLANEQEEEPGWSALKSPRLTTMLETAKKKRLQLSLLVFSGDKDAINMMVSKPDEHGRNLVADVAPIMKKYGFTDLNLDIESTVGASESARKNFTQFVKAVKRNLDKEKIGSLTLEITGDDLIRNKLIDTKAVAPLVDNIVLMAYDFHYMGSSVTGAVAPLYGAGVTSEYDTQAAVEKLLALTPASSIILGIPTYGYSWETIDPLPKAAVIPGTGITMSNKRMEKFLTGCGTCSAEFDQDAKESYVIYKDAGTNTFHQTFFPDQRSTKEKVNFAQSMGLGGVALWALGYEGKDIMNPLNGYIR